MGIDEFTELQEEESFDVFLRKEGWRTDKYEQPNYYIMELRKAWTAGKKFAREHPIIRDKNLKLWTKTLR